MTLKTLIVMLGGLIACGWQLWRAWARGKVAGGYGSLVERRKDPILFWMCVAVFGFGFFLFLLVLADTAVEAISN